jgi:hypothetical protein
MNSTSVGEYLYAGEYSIKWREIILSMQGNTPLANQSQAQGSMGPHAGQSMQRNTTPTNGRMPHQQHMDQRAHNQVLIDANPPNASGSKVQGPHVIDWPKWRVKGARVRPAGLWGRPVSFCLLSRSNSTWRLLMVS